MSDEKLKERLAAQDAELDKRNEATKVWIQSDTQCRAYAHKLEEELTRLRAEIEKANKQIDLSYECRGVERNEMFERIEKLESENQRLREMVEKASLALKFYADEDTWNVRVSPDGKQHYSASVADQGRNARLALSRVENNSPHGDQQ